MTMRPYLLFVSGVAGIVGVADGQEIGLIATFGAFLAFFFSYGFGQALTDCFQMDTDAISSPYRPLVQGVITRAQVLPVSLTGLFCCCIILVTLNPRTLVVGLLCVFGLATYTYFKRRWWGGPFYNAWIVALLPVMGKIAATNSSNSIIQIFDHGIIIPVVISVLFSYANFVLMGYFKDISADRASGYRTFVVVFGWKKAAIGSDIFALLSLLATGWCMTHVFLDDIRKWFAIIIYLAAVIVLVIAQYGIHKIRDEKKAYRPISNVVRGFILLHLAEISLLRPSWLPLIIIFYVIFELSLKVRPEKGQV